MRTSGKDRTPQVCGSAQTKPRHRVTVVPRDLWNDGGAHGCIAPGGRQQVVNTSDGGAGKLLRGTGQQAAGRKYLHLVAGKVATCTWPQAGQFTSKCRNSRSGPTHPSYSENKILRLEQCVCVCGRRCTCLCAGKVTPSGMEAASLTCESGSRPVKSAVDKRPAKTPDAASAVCELYLWQAAP